LPLTLILFAEGDPPHPVPAFLLPLDAHPPTRFDISTGLILKVFLFDRREAFRPPDHWRGGLVTATVYRLIRFP
jgi:hypothetical protein